MSYWDGLRRSKKRRDAGRWTYNTEAANEQHSKLTHAEVWSGKYGQCPMFTSIGKRCVKPYMHRRGHSTLVRTNA